jgi:bifunctional UDP-N-acetylglucosamine pyrophosphorylase/glucosamine-1-phosphate N-acetyltransferase
LLELCGDGPRISGRDAAGATERHLAEDCAATLATAVLEDPGSYGRIWRDSDGQLRGIVEFGDANAEQRAIHEINPSYYCFKLGDLLAALGQIKPNNVKNEYYITDALAILIGAGRRVQALTSVPPRIFQY